MGSFVAFSIAARRKAAAAYAVGALFWVGGVVAATMIPAPWWFIVLDLGVAYPPMAYLGARLGERFGPRRAGAVEQGAG